ncbi:MAG: efflux RND transporter periplasmic adaptor subunit [Alistipes sp.]|nr:efflux RND transporter periplasmic adaptor subunit [Alistipes sp.]
MKRLYTTLLSVMIIMLIVGAILLLARYFQRRKPILLQGRVVCTTYTASSKIAGRIVEMRVREGDNIEKGALLYRLSTPELDAKLIEARAAESAAMALDSKVLAGARRQQIETARSLKSKAQAALTLATKGLERAQNLYREGVISAQKLDEAEASYRAALADKQAAAAQYSLALAGAQREDKQAAAARVEAAQGAVAEVESYIEDAKVYAPITGEVSSITSEVGELVGTGTPVVEIIDMADAWAEFNIAETLLPAFTKGRVVTLYVPAIDRYVEMCIDYIAAEAEFATWDATRTRGSFDVRTFAVRLRPNMPIANLRPGMSVVIDYSQFE